MNSTSRPLTNPLLTDDSGYRLTREQLLFDLYIAYYDAARHKHKMAYVVKFERDLTANLNELCDDLLNRRYKALPSKCFVIDYPKKREVFAAMFRDRIVHHLYFRYTHQLFERTFIADSYSCIEGRGTHYGVDRLRQHIRRASLNWSQPCYAMNLDIRGYFMHINRQKLLKIATESLTKMAKHKVGLTDDVPIPSGVILTKSTTWADIRDFDFILWLTEQIVTLDPNKIENMRYEPGAHQCQPEGYVKWFEGGIDDVTVCRADVVAVGGNNLSQVDEGVLLAREGYLARGALAVLCRVLNVTDDSVTGQQLFATLAVLVAAGGGQLRLYRLSDEVGDFSHTDCAQLFLVGHGSVGSDGPLQADCAVLRPCAFIVLGRVGRDVQLELELAVEGGNDSTTTHEYSEVLSLNCCHCLELIIDN